MSGKSLEQKLLETVATLSTSLPLTRPVRFSLVRSLRSRKMRYHGCTEKGKDGFLITLARNRNHSIVVETLIHEWAHARSWSRTKVDHGKKWGEEYAAAYRTIIGD